MRNCKHSDVRKLLIYFKNNPYIPFKIAEYVIDRIPNGWLALNDEDGLTFYLNGKLEDQFVDGVERTIVGYAIDDRISINVDETFVDAINSFEINELKFQNIIKVYIYKFAFTVAHEMYHVLDNYELPNDEYHRIYDTAVSGRIDHENEARVDKMADEFMKKYGKRLIKKMLKI